MIKRETVDLILETARVEEVVGDFVNLKKRGVNLLGNCPFHDEKTPSFTVSPIKAIYKCFGCGKAGNAVNFVMEHEHFSYPEALRYLAKKYNIEIEEEKPTEEQKQQIDERESLFIALQFAQKYFTDNLYEEGVKTIGLQYFEERGFTTKTIETFELGFSPEGWDVFAKAAIKAGFKPDILVKAGLCNQREDGSLIDKFRGRVMFPIHSMAGRVLGFGGRILAKNAKEAKYLNSPETDVYHKSKILYGISQAKKAIREQDNCYLVEGYTDVLSLHQKGIQNVAASSGTSLTEDQIKLIKRYTENVTFLFDGDAAGLKAALRGIDIALKGGLNVKIVVFPDGEDPDSFAKQNSPVYLKDYLEKEAKDFVLFKTKMLLSGHEDDPVHKAEVTRDIIKSISCIADDLKRNIYIKQCSKLLDVSETDLLGEYNRQLRTQFGKEQQQQQKPQEELPEEKPTSAKAEENAISTLHMQEEVVIILLLLHGHKFFTEDESVAGYIFHELTFIHWESKICERLFDLYAQRIEEGEWPKPEDFLHHEDKEISEFVITRTTSKYGLSEKWKKQLGYDPRMLEHEYHHAVLDAVDYLKIRRFMQMIKHIQEGLKDNKDIDEEMMSLELTVYLQEEKKKLTDRHGMVVFRS